MRGLLSLRATDSPAGDAAAPARGPSVRRALIATLLVCGGYYAGGAIGMGLRLVPGGPTEIWLPQGILLAALLTAPARRWWLYAVALLPTHAHLTVILSPRVPASMMLVQFVGQFVQAALAAALLRRILGDPPRLDSLRRMGAFIFGGTFLVPCVVQVAVVGVYVATGFVHDFWAPWQQRVLARMAGSVIVAAPVLHLAADGLAEIRGRPRRVAELALLTASLSAAVAMLFAGKPGHAAHQWLVIVPLPFLLWSAVRFGPGGLGVHLLVVVLGVLLCTRAGRGPFVTGSVDQIIIELQGFFLFISIPLMMLAALVWEHAQAAASLRRSQEQYRSVVEDQTDLICRFQPDGTYTFVNAAYCRYFQRSADELIGQKFWQFVPVYQREISEAFLAGITPAKPIASIEHQVTAPGGDARWMEWTDRGHFDDRGRLVEFQAVGHDVTDRKRAEEEHRRLVAQARVSEVLREVDRRKDEFLAMVSHELRNPLAPIAMAIEVMRMREPTDDSTLWARDVIARQTAQLTRLVDDLLDVSRITLGKITLNRSEMDLRPLVEQAVEAARPHLTARHHQLAVDVAPEPLPIWGDGARLIQIISNLLNNAARFTAEGGHIALAVRRDGARIVLSVKDDGVGIPPDMRERVFDMFTQIEWPAQRKGEGLGIGLALVKRLVEMHDGDIEARSDGPGRGSELVVRLPIAAAARSLEEIAGASAGGARDAAGESRPERILVVDDNVDAAESLSRLLRLHAHEVRVAYDGVAALDAARDMNPDIVLLDIGLPKMDGLEVAKNLRARGDGPRPLLVAMTGFGQAEDRARTAAAGFDHHLTKPVDPKMLQSLVETARGARV
jgi:PAS domain S-box-containing protein